MKSRQALVIEQSRRDGLSIRQLARHFAGARGHWRIVGTAAQVADELQARFEDGAADGFNVMPSYFPGELDALRRSSCRNCSGAGCSAGIMKAAHCATIWG